jgi:predicted Zn-dependent peptidase
LEEAAAEARRISPSEPDRVSGLVAVATRLYELDRARAWEYVNEAVKAANSGETYSGEDSHIGATVRAKNFAYATNSSVESFDLAGLFRTLTKEDLNRAIQTAKGFNQETPRATALLSVARQILAKKGGEASIRQERSVSEEN